MSCRVAADLRAAVWRISHPESAARSKVGGHPCLGVKLYHDRNFRTGDDYQDEPAAVSFRQRGELCSA